MWIAARAHAIASITVADNQDMEAELPSGLVVGHAYGVTDVRVIHKLAMIRLRNPWGSKEWNGAWGDNSPEWKSLSSRERHKLGLELEDDGEFYMMFDDFCEHFTTFNTCSVVNTALLNLEKTYHPTVLFSEWAGDTAGGCKNEATYMSNPQFLLQHPQGGEVIVGLHQLDMRAERHLGHENATIGFQVMKIEENRRYRLTKPLPVVAKTSYINAREVVVKTRLSKGVQSCATRRLWSSARG